MTKRSLLLAALLPALAVGGCMGTQNQGLESVHQPVVSRADYLLDLRIAGDGLSVAEGQRLAGWLSSLRLGYGDRVSVDDPEGRSPAVRGAIARVVADYGLLLAAEAPVSAAPVTPGTVRVVVSRMTARVPGCPDWSRDSSVDYEQHTSSNFGCAQAVNLAAMVANPQDLIRGTASTGSDAATGYKAIDTYRKAVTTGATGLPGGVTSVSVTGGGK